MLWRLAYLLHLCGEDPINLSATWISLQFNVQWHHLGSLKWATIYMKEIGKCCTAGLDGFVGWSDQHNRMVGKILVMINRLSLTFVMSVTLWITQKLRKQSSSIWKLSDSTKKLLSWLMKKWFSTMCLCHFAFFLLINIKKEKNQPTFILKLYSFIGCSHTWVAVMNVWQNQQKYSLRIIWLYRFAIKDIIYYNL